MTAMEMLCPIIRASNRMARDGDYLKDGMLVCGKCHEPRQINIEVDGQVITPWCLCKCEEENLLKGEWDRHIAELRMGLPESARSARMADWTGNERQRKVVDKYLAMWDTMRQLNMGMLFCGGVGTGKTFAAAALANALIEKGVRVRWQSFPTMLESSSKGFGERADNITERIGGELLILDDFGASRETEYALESMYMAINARYEQHRPTIITTNISLEELQKASNPQLQRVYDRILEMCTPISFAGESRRKAIADDKRNKLREAILNEQN